tara:strand:+ start:196 stop:441 length:246 start_codon:yes stop_codon:yes gene_type:complete
MMIRLLLRDQCHRLDVSVLSGTDFQIDLVDDQVGVELIDQIVLVWLVGLHLEELMIDLHRRLLHVILLKMIYQSLLVNRED